MTDDWNATCLFGGFEFEFPKGKNVFSLLSLDFFFEMERHF